MGDSLFYLDYLLFLLNEATSCINVPPAWNASQSQVTP